MMDQHVTIEQRVAQHYAQNNLERTILGALAASGKDINKLTCDDLAPIDEFHTGGRMATVEFAEQLNLKSEMRILDLGCGIGGASRFIAGRYGCHVTGIDITEEYVRTAQSLAGRVGLADRVTFQHASAVDLPFETQSFDGAYMMHVGMNIEDKTRLFSEVRRVLKNGSVFGIYDVLLTGLGDPKFPLPCALTSDIAFIEGAGAYRRGLTAAGFEIEAERNRLDVAREFFRQEQARGAEGEGPPALGIHILLKQEAPRILANTMRQFESGVFAPVEFICRAREPSQSAHDRDPAGAHTNHGATK